MGRNCGHAATVSTMRQTMPLAMRRTMPLVYNLCDNMRFFPASLPLNARLYGSVYVADVPTLAEFRKGNCSKKLTSFVIFSEKICIVPRNYGKNKQLKQSALVLACPAAGRGAIHSRACETIPQTTLEQPKNPSCCRSRGGMRGWPDSTGQHMTTPVATSPQNKRQQHPNHRHSGISAAVRVRPARLAESGAGV